MGGGTRPRLPEILGRALSAAGGDPRSGAGPAERRPVAGPLRQGFLRLRRLRPVPAVAFRRAGFLPAAGEPGQLGEEPGVEVTVNCPEFDQDSGRTLLLVPRRLPTQDC